MPILRLYSVTPRGMRSVDRLALQNLWIEMAA